MSFTTHFSTANYRTLVLVGLIAIAPHAGAATKLGSLKLTGAGNAMELPIGFLSDDGVTCLQFDLAYNPVSLPLGVPVTGIAAPGHRLDSTLVASGLRRVVIYSTTLAPLDGGVIVRFPTGGVSPSAALPTVSNVRLVSTSGHAVALAGTDLRPVALDGSVPVTGLVGKSLTLNAPTGGLEPLAYQWLFEGAPIEGATASNYTINQLVSANAGSYSVRMGNPAGEVVSAIATLTVIGNTAPTFSNYAVATEYQTAATISLAELLASAADADGDTLSVIATGPSVHAGMVVLQAGSIIYTPPTGFEGSDTFPVTLSDGRGGSVLGTVTVEVRPDTGLGAESPVLTLLSDGRMRVDFQGFPGRAYVVARSTDLSNWQTLATVTGGPTGAVSFIDEFPPTGSGFYRLNRP